MNDWSVKATYFYNSSDYTQQVAELSTTRSTEGNAFIIAISLGQPEEAHTIITGESWTGIR